MAFWKENIDKIIELNDKVLLTHKGNITHAQMEKLVEALYEKFEVKRKVADTEQADQQDLEELKQLEQKIKEKK